MTADAEIERRILRLEKQANQVLKLKRSTLSRRPIVIEFAGSPKSGKSSCISSLDIFLRRNDFKTHVLSERASVCPIENKFDPLFNIWNGCAALNELSEIISNRPREYDIVILDRGFFDTLCWFEWQKKEGYLRDEDFERFNGFFTSPRFRMMVDLVIMFDASPETSLNREYKNLLTRKGGSVMRESVLTGYRSAAKVVEKKAKSLFRHIVDFNTDKLSQDEVSFDVTKLCLNKLDEVAREKIGFIPKAEVEKNDIGGVFSFSDISPTVDSYLSFAERETVEKDKSVVQLIPIAFIKDTNDLKFIVARKRKDGSNGSPEDGKILLYFGGHVREEDKTLFHDPSGIDVLKQCLYREVKEELGIDITVTEDDPICIWIRDGKRSEQHIAVAFIAERDLEYTKIQIDEREFVRLTKKEKYGTGSKIDLQGITDNLGKIDQWSRNVLRSKFSEEFERHNVQKSLWDTVATGHT